MGYLLQEQSSKWLVVQNELIEAGTGLWSKAYIHMWLIEEANIQLVAGISCLHLCCSE